MRHASRLWQPLTPMNCAHQGGSMQVLAAQQQQAGGLRPKPQQQGRAAGGAGGGSGGAAGDPVGRARQRMGYKNNWCRTNVDESQQVCWQRPLGPQEPVAIIGGGISGLACAQRLAQHGMRAVVFDTGEHGVGGRAATRRSDDGSLSKGPSVPPLSSLPPAQQQQQQLVFDHAAQCFSASDAAFQQQVEAWEAAGAVMRWRGPVGTLAAGAGFKPLGPDAPPLYVAAGGMRRLAERMAAEAVACSSGAVEVVRPMWVSRMTASQAAGGWQLTGNNKGLGTFGAVVVAHNGKCANRLVGPTGAPLVAKQLMRLRLSAVWALMVAFDGPVDVPGGMEGAFVRGSSVLSWAGNNTAKLGLSPSGLQCWTLISTNSYGQANKVPQERVPADVAAKVAGELLGEFRSLLGGAALPAPVFTRSQLWGAALPLNTPRVPCILDGASRVGVCGDWLSGASIQSAVLSGWALADRLAALRGASGAAADALSLGLRDEFVPLGDAAEIGEFPGLRAVPAAPPAAAARGGAGGGRHPRREQRQPVAAGSAAGRRQ